QHFRVVSGDAEGSDKTRALGERKFGKRRADFLAPRGADVHWQKIRLWEIAVVVRLFLRAHGIRAARVLIPKSSLLRDAAARFQDADVALDFIFEGFGKVAEGVEILHLDLGAEFLGAAQAHAHIGVATQRAFFHVAVTHAGVKKDLAD